MKKLIIGLVAIVVLLVVAVIVAPFFIPLETIKAEAIAQAKQATGRDVRIDGDFKLSLFPNAELVAGKVSVGNVQGAKAAQMVAIESVNVSVALLPLIGGNVEVNAFVIEKPVINLEIDKNGKPNWEFTAAGAEDAKSASTESKPAESGGGSPLAGITLDDVRLVDGTITYSDARSGLSHRLDAINWTVELPSLSDPVAVNGDFVWNKEKIDIALTLTSPDTFLNAKETAIETSISAAPVKLDFKGSATNAATLKAGGAVTLDVPSIRNLAAWAGSPIDAPGSGFGPLKVTGNVAVDGSKYAFKQAKLAVDKIEGSGDFAFDGGGKVPAVSAVMKLGVLDLNPYLPPEGETASKPAASSQSAGSGGSSAPPDWSDDPIDMSGLKAANANLDLTVAGILVRKIKVGESNLKVSLKNGILTTDLTKLALYKGNGTAKITANAAGAKPKIAVNFDLKGFDASPFLKDAADFDRLEGTANADLAVTTPGSTERQLVSALNGRGKVQFLDGAIVGINLAAMLRNVSSAFLDQDAGKTQKTDFAELKGTYTIKNGLVTNNDLSLKSPFIRVTGKGTSDMPKRTVNYRVTPKAVASAKGQGGSDAGGIQVPVVVTGPWHDLSYKPDLTAVIGDVAKDPKKALEAVKKVVPGVPKLGGSGSGSSGSSLPKAEDAVKGLKNIFSR